MEVVDAECDFVVEEAEVEAYVGLSRFLPLEVGVGELCGLGAVYDVAVFAEDVVVARRSESDELEVADILVTVFTPRSAELEVIEPRAAAFHK